jgi:electron transport complex protein RnfD
MRQVIYALLPALIALIWAFGSGVLINVCIAGIAALVFESLMLQIRGQSVQTTITDYSALLTAMLLAMAIPPLTPWWITVTGVFFAIVVAKHLYGGLGQNLFNPAMVGYAVLIISFPAEMSAWSVTNLGDIGNPPGVFDSLRSILLGLPVADALSSATPLDAVKSGLSMKQTVSEIHSAPQFSALFGVLGGKNWEIVNGLAAGGGLWLLYKGIIRWHIPVAMLSTLILVSFLFYFADDAIHASPIFHLFSGGTMLCAFFIATDPVTAAASNKGRIIYGIGIGLIIYIIRSWGAYPDGIAFAILLMNLAVPIIDRYTRPTRYGTRDQKR